MNTQKNLMRFTIVISAINGVWAIFSSLDPRVLQFKPGLLMNQANCEEVLRRLEIGIGLANDEVMNTTKRFV